MGITTTEAAELFRRAPDRFFDVRAGEVAHRVVGQGPDVLFVHGWPVSSATFRTLLPSADRSLLEGEFDEFFLQPLYRSNVHRDASLRLLKSFDWQHIHDLDALHKRIGVPVQLVWGEQDRFFPVASAEAMVKTFPNADLQIIAGAGLFAHEERPQEVATALLPLLT